MINRQLIAAERANRASQGFVDQGNVIQQGMLESVNLIRQDVARQTAKKNAANQKVASYINQLNSDVDLTSLTETQQQSVNNFLVNGRNEYADIAVRLSKMDDPSSPQYMEDKNRLNSISRSFQNLSSQVKNYKNDKISYLKDFDESLLSDGNKADTVENAASVYTNEADFAVNQSGGLMIWDNNNEDYKGYGEIEKPFLKDFQSADKILSMNEGIYKRGQELTGANETLTRQKLKQMVNKGGRDTLLSLASDDFIMEGGLGLQDPALFEPGNEAALSNAVVDGYMNVLKDSAKQGAEKINPGNNPKNKPKYYSEVRGDNIVYFTNNPNDEPIVKPYKASSTTPSAQKADPILAAAREFVIGDSKEPLTEGQKAQILKKYKELKNLND